MKIVIDTNAWISFLINNTEKDFVSRLLHSNIDVITSVQVFEEIRRIGMNSKFRPYFSEARLAELLESLKKMGSLMESVPALAVFRDPKDEFLLDLCQASQADFLVTGDKALLELEIYHHTQIITLKELKEMLF